MADTAFTVKVDGRTFTIDRITLGDWRMFNTEFGLEADNVITSVEVNGETHEGLNLKNPNVLFALIVAAMHHDDPKRPIRQIIAEVDEISLSGLEFVVGDDAEEADPTKAGADEATGDPSASGKSGKRRKTPGTPS